MFTSNEHGIKKQAQVDFTRSGWRQFIGLNRMSGDFPTLLPGSNAISWTGNVTKVVIQPNWRYL